MTMEKSLYNSQIFNKKIFQNRLTFVFYFYEECPFPFLCSQIITPFLNSMISTNPVKRVGILAYCEILIPIILPQVYNLNCLIMIVKMCAQNSGLRLSPVSMQLGKYNMFYYFIKKFVDILWK